MIRKLYDWVLSWAEHRYSSIFLAVITFIEASFFPIPNYPLLIAICVSRPKKSLWAASISTVSSVLGGIFGYFVGLFLWEQTSHLFFKYIFSEQMYLLVSEKFQANTFIAVLIGCFTPIPFKVFTITAGATHVPLLQFILAITLGRSFRFYLIGFLFYFWGEPVKQWMEKHFDRAIWITTLALGLIGAIYYVWRSYEF